MTTSAIRAGGASCGSSADATRATPGGNSTPSAPWSSSRTSSGAARKSSTRISWETDGTNATVQHWSDVQHPPAPARSPHLDFVGPTRPALPEPQPPAEPTDLVEPELDCDPPAAPCVTDSCETPRQVARPPVLCEPQNADCLFDPACDDATADCDPEPPASFPESEEARAREWRQEVLDRCLAARIDEHRACLHRETRAAEMMCDAGFFPAAGRPVDRSHTTREECIDEWRHGVPSRTSSSTQGAQFSTSAGIPGVLNVGGNATLSATRADAYDSSSEGFEKRCVAEYDRSKQQCTGQD